MRIIIDSAIPYIKGVLEPFFEIIYMKGANITPSDTLHADGMIIRTRTKCNSSLLSHSRVQFIGSATIGYDHIDIAYCKSKEIKVVTAAGCNALAVVQYVMRGIYELERVTETKVNRVGIIGVGNVGQALANELIKRGYSVMLNDPPRAEKESDFKNTPLNTLLEQSDLITLHTPLDSTTRGFADKSFFGVMGSEKLFINASRGEVIDEVALIDAIDKGIVKHPIIDVWCNEPNISKELVNRCFITTPHIAGYSQQGKANGTAMMVQAIAQHFNIKELLDWYPTEVIPNNKREININNYNIIDDSNNLHNNLSKFEELRNNYNYRNEY